MSYHIPILTKEISDNLNINPQGTYIDCTIGFGGHASMILEKLNSDGTLIGIDLDPYALKIAKEKLRGINSNKIILKNDSYINFPNILRHHEIDSVDGFLFDLGISSYQVDSEHRGFSYRYNSPLDMQFNPRKSKYNAKYLINHLSEKKLNEIFKTYGEERFSKRIARNIVLKRKQKKIETTFDLKKIIYDAIPFKSIKVLSRIFQAIRIAVNDELNVLKNTLEHTLEYLKVGGRIAVISFHSMEDRIVKHFFKGYAINNENLRFRIITKKPMTPSNEEVKINKRSRSAKLRIAERIA